MNAWQNHEEASHDDKGAGRYTYPSTLSPGRFSDSELSRSLFAAVAPPFGARMKTLTTLLYLVGALAVLSFIHGGWFRLTGEEVRALDRVVFAGGILVLSVWFFPWHRFGRNAFLIPIGAALVLITLAVYFSGGWGSPLSIFYIFVVVFCASYFSSGVAAVCVAVSLVASLSPQLYAPDPTRMAEHLVVQIPLFTGLFLACRYASWDRKSLQQERDSERIRDLEERLWHEASLDPLTGLYNRARFETQFNEEFERARRTGEWFMVLFVDVDDLKNVNDNYGHRTGDEALKLVASILQSCSRRIDVVARYGGDEFTVMLPGASLPEAHRFFERMRDQVAERSGRTLGLELRLSAGAVQCPGYAADPATLLDAADKAMYRAKRRGKNRLFAALSLAPAEHRRELPAEE